VTRESFRDEISKEFDAISGPPRPALSARVRSALTETRPAPAGPFWMAGVAAALIALIIVGALLVANFNRRPTGIVPGAVPTASPYYTTVSPAPTPSADVLPPKTVWTCSSSSTTFDYASSAPPASEIDAVRTGTHTGYDRITIEFKTFHVNDYSVEPQSNAKFTQGASGQPVILRGNAGLLMTIHGADAHTSYSGPTDFKTNYVVLVEARQVQDFEGTVQWALGLSKAACYRTYFLANPSRLVIDVQNN
jgi:hypothetical protein